MYENIAIHTSSCSPIVIANQNFENLFPFQFNNKRTSIVINFHTVVIQLLINFMFGDS